MGVDVAAFGGVTQAQLNIVAAKKPYPGVIAIVNIAQAGGAQATYTLRGTATVAGVTGKYLSLAYVKWGIDKVTTLHANDGWKITYQFEDETETTLDEVTGTLAAADNWYYREPITTPPISAASGKSLTIKIYSKSGETHNAAIAANFLTGEGAIIIATGGTMV
jgi:hypothetical protein